MPVKGSTITDENYLKILAQAREKALATRRAKADEKKKIKLAQDLEHQTKLKEAEEKLKDVTEAVVATKAAKVAKEKKPEAQTMMSILD